MRKQGLFILCGCFAGIIDIIPMIIMRLNWEADLSAFSMWVVIGYILSITTLRMNQIYKSIIISFLVLIPNIMQIAQTGIFNLIPVIIMTLILSIVLGIVTRLIENRIKIPA